jgi:uncharacterized protein YbaR (Trm112 family)
MKEITSPADFKTLLAGEHAIVFIFFSWSRPALESEAVVREWEKKLAAQPGQNTPVVYQLSPDQHGYTWKWLNEAFDDSEAAPPVSGCILWLQRGSVVGCVTDAAAAGAKTLSRITRDCFSLGKNHASSATTWLSDETTAFNPDLLQILCCPETHQKLKLATFPLLEKLNQQILGGRMQNRSGQSILDAIDGGLVRADGQYLYPLRQNIPILLVDEAVPLAGF